jgi:energy-coupling factor transport system ATP-binding protein
MRAIAGVLNDTESGELTGSIVTDSTGLLLQDPNDSIISGSIFREVAFGLENTGLPRVEMPPLVRKILDSVGLSKPLEHPSRELSGGEMQRMAFAGVIATQPDVLLLDEPTSMLDEASAASVRHSVSLAVEQRKSTLIVVEHRFEAWLPLVDRMLVLSPTGSLIFDGKPAAVLSEHAQELLDLGIWVPGVPTPEPKKFSLGTHGSGQITALTGMSGAGKTTELKRRLRADPMAATILTGAGYVPQQPEITTIGNTVFESTFLTARMAAQGLGLPEGDARTRTMALLDTLGVSHLVDRNPYEISGGEQRRVALATALAHFPMVVYLDEPTVGQDRESWARIVGVILAAREAGVKVTLATHDLALIALADEVIDLEAEVAPDKWPPPALISGLVGFLAPLIFLLGSLAVTSLASAIALAASVLVTMAAVFYAGLRIPKPKVLLPGVFGVLSIGLSNWYLSADMAPENGLIAGLKAASFIIPGIIFATQIRPIPLGDQLAQTLRFPARPVIAAVAAMQRMGSLIDLWDELRFIHKIRGIGSGRGPKARIQEFARLMFGLLVQAVRDAGTTAVAMDSRGFSRPFGGPKGRRTWAEVPRWGRLDGLTLCLAVGAAITPLLFG